MQCTGAVDHVPRPYRPAICERHFPQAGFIVEAGQLDTRLQFDVRPQAVLVDTALRIGLDLVPRRVFARPVGVGFEGKAIEVGHHVAGGAGITVPIPGAADFRGLVKNPEVSDARIQQTFADANPGETGANDQGVEGVVFVASHAVYNNVNQRVLNHASNHPGRRSRKSPGAT